MFLRVTGACAGGGGSEVGGAGLWGTFFFFSIQSAVIKQFRGTIHNVTHAAVIHIKENNGINSMIMHQLHHIR